MITSEDGLRQSLDQLNRVNRVIAALRTEHPQATESWLALMAEGWIDQAEQLQLEIEEYTGVTSLTKSEPRRG